MFKNEIKLNLQVKLLEESINQNQVVKLEMYPHIKLFFLKKKNLKERMIYLLLLLTLYIVHKNGYYLAIISTMVETDNPAKEIQTSMDIFEPVFETFD